MDKFLFAQKKGQESKKSSKRIEKKTTNHGYHGSYG